MNLNNLFSHLSPVENVILIVAIFAWEAWLGYNDKTRSGSTVELLVNTAKSLFGRIMGTTPAVPEKEVSGSNDPKPK